MARADAGLSPRAYTVGLGGIGCVLAIAAAVTLVVAAYGFRFGWWDVRTAFTIVRWTVYGSIGVLAISILGFIGALRRRGKGGLALAILGVILSALAIGIPYANWTTLRNSPRLTDITTDTQNPPQFVADAVLRKNANATNPITYTPEKAAIQARAYPDIKPLHLNVPPARAYDAALETTGRLGWTVIAKDPAAGRIEAIDRSMFFGFIDDIVIRVRPEDGGSRVDVRSASRIGRRDGNVNANRVRAFLASLHDLPKE